MPSAVPGERIHFRLPKTMEGEWNTWKSQAAAAELSIRDWMFRQIRVSLRQAAHPAESPLTILNRGRRQGILMGKLDYAFRREREDDLSVPPILKWCRDYPHDVLDIIQWCAVQSYGGRFRQWWRQEIAPHLEHEDAHTHA